MIYNVPVTWECYGTVEVEATSAEEAIKYVEDNMDEIELPKDAEYVDDSFKFSIDDREELIAMIKMID